MWVRNDKARCLSKSFFLFFFFIFKYIKYCYFILCIWIWILISVSAASYSWWLPSLYILWLLIVKMFLGILSVEFLWGLSLLSFLQKGYIFISAHHQGTLPTPNHLYFNFPRGPPSAQIKAGKLPYCPLLCSMFISCSPYCITISYAAISALTLCGSEA